MNTIEAKCFKVLTCDPNDDVVDNFSSLHVGVAKKYAVNTYTEASLFEKISKLADAEAKELLIHIYTYEGKVMEIKGDGKFWNHSHVNQNTGNHPDGLGDGESEYALRDIEVGEELLSDYSSYHPVGWFEEMCKK